MYKMRKDVDEFGGQLLSELDEMMEKSAIFERGFTNKFLRLN